MQKRILGISAYFHDAAAAIIVNGEIIAAAQEERFSRIKNDPSFPSQAIRHCLKSSGLSLDQLDAVVFYDKPFLKFERLLETYYAFAPKGFASFVRAMPRWMKEQLLLKQQIRRSLKEIEAFDKRKLKLLFSEHHLSHAASAFYPSPFHEAAILTIDGVGEWATAVMAHGVGRDLKVLKELHFPHSLGLLYSAFTYYLGFRVNSGEYKLMGLAAYGNENSNFFQQCSHVIKKELVDLKADGSLRLNQRYFSYATGLRMLKDKKWENLFGLKRRLPKEAISSDHADLALAIQRFTEEVVVKMAKALKRLTGAKYLCLAGGVALNGVANGKIIKEGLFDEIFIQPAAGDAGGALGAAEAVYHLYFNGPRAIEEKKDMMNGALLGPTFSDEEIKQTLQTNKLASNYFTETDSLVDYIANEIAAGKIIGWFQGCMEFGPRALGNRSIIADTRNPEMQQRLNLKIKNRESFRPFAPIVLAEDVDQYFELTQASPYMNIVAKVKDEQMNPFPLDYENWSIRNKLAFAKSKIPAVTHVDGTARIQTVEKKSNPKLYALLQAFKSLTGYGILVNTSFNGADEPIVCKPQDAIDCFLNTEMDLLVLGNHVLDKSNISG